MTGQKRITIQDWVVKDARWGLLISLGVALPAVCAVSFWLFSDEELPFLIGGMVFVILFTYAVVERFMRRKACLASHSVKTIIKGLQEANSFRDIEKFKIDSWLPAELSALLDQFKSANRRLIDEEKLRMQSMRISLANDIAAQVAHDLRSPLSALDLVLAKTADIPDDKKTLARTAISRINAVANGLLAKQAGDSFVLHGNYIERLEIKPASRVVIVDDDPCIHGVWRMRFDSSFVMKKGVQVLYFSSPDEFGNWAKSAGDEAESLFLMDLEFKGSSLSGLDLIERFHLNGYAVLVTSRSEDSKVMGRATRLNVPVLPKERIGFIPIECWDKGVWGNGRAARV